MLHNIDNGLILVSLALVVLFVLYFVASITFSLYFGHAPSVFNVTGMLREFVGLTVRKVRKLPAVPEHVVALHFFRLPLNATRNDVELAANRMFGELFNEHYWAYPASQRRVLRQHVKCAVDALAFHEACQQMTREGAGRQKQREERARAHREARQANPAGEGSHGKAQASGAEVVATSGWRAVLGLPRAERDVARIKKAYRKRISVAHSDHGGNNHDLMASLTVAMGQARDELSFV